MRELTEKLTRAIRDFSDYIQGLPPTKLELSKTVPWGPKEVLCHFVFWHEQYCAIVAALLKKEKPNLLVGSFKEYNALAVRLNKDESYETLIKRFLKAQKELSLLCNTPQSINIKISFKVGGKVRTLPEVLVKIEAHIRSHQRQLLRAGYK